MLTADLDVIREQAAGVVMGWIHSTKEREGPGRICQHGPLVLHVRERGQLWSQGRGMRSSVGDTCGTPKPLRPVSPEVDGTS